MNSNTPKGKEAVHDMIASSLFASISENQVAAVARIDWYNQEYQLDKLAAKIFIDRTVSWS